MVRKIGTGVVVLVLAFLLFAVWYRSYYAMEVAPAYEVNSPALAQKLLIATQGSAYKDAVVDDLVSRLRGQPVYVRVVDVSSLPDVDEANWTAILVVHTWEYQRPQPAARDFIERAKDRKKLVVLTTSGEGNQAMEGVNAVTSASSMNNIIADVDALMTRLAPLLGSRPSR
jgi:Na+-transporting methylmalonyl-CoA/oxaloacetate decarboxylase gamma subunit